MQAWPPSCVSRTCRFLFLLLCLLLHLFLHWLWRLSLGFFFLLFNLLYPQIFLLHYCTLSLLRFTSISIPISPSWIDRCHGAPCNLRCHLDLGLGDTGGSHPRWWRCSRWWCCNGRRRRWLFTAERRRKRRVSLQPRHHLTLSSSSGGRGLGVGQCQSLPPFSLINCAPQGKEKEMKRLSWGQSPYCPFQDGLESYQTTRGGGWDTQWFATPNMWHTQTWQTQSCSYQCGTLTAHYCGVVLWPDVAMKLFRLTLAKLLDPLLNLRWSPIHKLVSIYCRFWHNREKLLSPLNSSLRESNSQLTTDVRKLSMTRHNCHNF